MARVPGWSMAEFRLEPRCVCSKPELCPRPHVMKVSLLMKGSWTQVVRKGTLGHRRVSASEGKKSHLHRAIHISSAHSSKNVETVQRKVQQRGLAEQRRVPGHQTCAWVTKPLGWGHKPGPRFGVSTSQQGLCNGGNGPRGAATSLALISNEHLLECLRTDWRGCPVRLQWEGDAGSGHSPGP